LGKLLDPFATPGLNKETTDTTWPPEVIAIYNAIEPEPEFSFMSENVNE